MSRCTQRAEQRHEEIVVMTGLVVGEVGTLGVPREPVNVGGDRSCTGDA